VTNRLLTSLLCSAALGLAYEAKAQEEWEDVPEGHSQAGYDVQVDVEGAGAVNLQSFESGLSPYGDWVSTPSYGSAWRPRVAAGWRPYYYGRWEWTNEGWLWVSEEPFGWATYHYGRWAWDAGQGWLWVPGYQWAPAWVSWRYGGDVVGWAPLAPGLSLYVTNYAFIDFWWTFVPSVRFCGAPVWGSAYAPGRAHQFYAVTSPAPPRPRPSGMVSPGGGGGRPPPPGDGRPTPAWGGPSPRYIEERSGRSVSTSRIVPAPRPGAVRSRPGEIGVYRPETSLPPGGATRSLPQGSQPRQAPQPYGPPSTSQPRYAPPPSSQPRYGTQPPQSSPRYAPPPSSRPDGRATPAARGNPAPQGGASPRGGSWDSGGSRAPSGGGSAPRGGGMAPSHGGGGSRQGGSTRHR
jgi:hypothetical protein